MLFGGNRNNRKNPEIPGVPFGTKNAFWCTSQRSEEALKSQGSPLGPECFLAGIAKIAGTPEIPSVPLDEQGASVEITNF
jgi:hypothetical protein